MDYQMAGFWLGTISLGVNTLLFFYVRRSEKSQAKDKDLAEFRADVDSRLDAQKERIVKLEIVAHPESKIDVDACCTEFGQRLSMVEQGVKAAPTHADLARIHSRIDDVASGVARIEGENSAQTRILNLVYESLVK